VTRAPQDRPGLDPAPRSRIVVTVVVTQVVVMLVTATVVYAAWRHLDGNLQAGAAIHHATPKRISQQDGGSPTEPLNILVLGTDTRSGSSDAIDGEAGWDCSDTSILVHVAADRRSAYGISIPRDALVDLVACTRDVQYADTGLVEWNAAYAAGGAACTASQLEQDFHIYVDDYVVLDFNGFEKMVDAVGGVDVCIPFELADPTYAKVDFKPGRNVHLDGASALKYVRLRHVLAGTDIGRIRRQQTFIGALVGKVVSAGTLTRPDRLFEFADSLTRSVTTDPELAHVRALVRLAEQFRGTDPSSIRFVTLPNEIYPVARSDPRWGRVRILPPAYRLMGLVARDEPLGRLARDALDAGGHRHAHASRRQEDQAAAAGICA
jgi:LCP family protein required for cell wall assembly